jgi:ATP-dependent Lhr-like helicase
MARTSADFLEYHCRPSGSEIALSILVPPVANWFRATYGKPTPCQSAAWPLLAAGKNVLVCAPTGTGKTLAAFLPILTRLVDEPVPLGMRCLYVTPLKALANDALKNLRNHLSAIARNSPLPIVLRGEGLGVRASESSQEQHVSARDANPLPLSIGGEGKKIVSISLRTGDSSPAERRALRNKPSDILITTPESLAILLSQPMSRALFANLRWVVVDEIHALAPNKRGADLALSLERLSALAQQPIQRIGLSATCTPVDEVARFLVGHNRSCTIVALADPAPLHVQIEPLSSGVDSTVDGSPDFFGSLVERLKSELETYTSTLIFTNARGSAERLAWRLRRRFPEWDAAIAVHHSSLSKTRRIEVEQKLKQGALRAVVSSTSLELGIDVGSVDNVVLVRPPGAVSRFLQRVGRSGHQPGRPRRGLILTTNDAELLEATATGACGQAVQYEAIKIPDHPLDVLCQHLVGMASASACQPDETFALLRGAYPYRNLTRADYDACLAYLLGKKSDGSDWLPPRLRSENGSFTIYDALTARLLRRNLGTILTDELRSVWIHQAEPEMPATREIGQIDEDYADRLKPGERFLLDGRCLEYRKMDGWNVVVDEVIGRPVTPRWLAQGWSTSAELARHLYLLRTRAAEVLRDGPKALTKLLREEYGLGNAAIYMLAEYFYLQEIHSEIPDGVTLLIECVLGESQTNYYLHTPLHQPANQALAQVVVARLASKRQIQASSVVADLGFVLTVQDSNGLTPDDFRDLLASEGFAADLESALANSEILRERFQRLAHTGLMLLRQPLNGRRRVGGRNWAQRRLFDQVRAKEPDFVLLRQAMGEVLMENCDLPAAIAYVDTLARLTIRCRRLNQPSPFAQHWTQVRDGPDDAVLNPTAALERLHAELHGEPGRVSARSSPGANATGARFSHQSSFSHQSTWRL